MVTFEGPAMRIRVCIASGLLLATTTVAPADDTFKAQSGQRQLFLDDLGIERIENLTRSMHQPAKKGAVIRPNWPEGQTSLQTRSGPFWDPQDKVFKFWVSSGNMYGTSSDGLHWDVKPNPSKGTSQVFYDPIDPDPARRYKSFNPGQLAVSPDGKIWTTLKGVSIPSQDEFNFSFDQTERLYIATVKHSGPYGRSVHLSTSRDFEQWTKPELIFHADDLDQQLGRRNIKARLDDPTRQKIFYNDPTVYNVEVYNMAVFRYEGLYIGIPAMYHAVGKVPNYPNTVGFQMLQLTCSRDLKNWKRLGDRKAFIPYSPRDSGAYDLTQMAPPSFALRRGPNCPADAGGLDQDELWFYYTAVKYRGGWEYVGTFPNGKHIPFPHLDRDSGAINLAVLRRDGFVSLDGDEQAGDLLTKTLVVEGDQLLLNLDAHKGGSARVEVIGDDDKPLAGFSLDDSIEVNGTATRQQARWSSGADWRALRGQAVRLRIRLRSASLYSFWTESQPRVVCIGDSIRMGYEPTVIQELGNRVQVIEMGDIQCGNTRRVLEHLDEWVIRHNPDIVHLNAGLHDIARDPGPGPTTRVPLAEYHDNLERIVATIQEKTCARIILSTTTPVDLDRQHAVNYGINRINADVLDYNKAMREIAARGKAVIHDLHKVVVQHGVQKMLEQDGVHFTDEAKVILGKAVAAAILLESANASPSPKYQK